MKKLDRKKIDAFWEKRTKIKDTRKSTHFRNDDMHVFDLKLIEKYITSHSKVLDLGAGTCYHTNLLLPKVAYIKAVDKFGKFLNHCTQSRRLEVEEADALGYNDGEKYNIILLLGIMNYFCDSDALQIYKNCQQMLAKNGVLIVKHQSGVNKDVIVDSYSDIIGDTYHALYRHVKKDEKLIKTYFDVEVVDIYPKRLNPWPNTHFYAYVCKNK